ncbi:MAG: aldose 1-epimerase [archaeon]
MYEIHRYRFGKTFSFILANRVTGERVSIIPSYGANVNDITLRKGSILFPVIDGVATYEGLYEDKWFKGAKLTPFPNRIKDGSYYHLGRNHNLSRNYSFKHAIHGLVYNKTFRVTEKFASRACARITMQYNSTGHLGYPFHYSVTLIYSLRKDGFLCVTHIRNLDKVKIPVGDGWHPYFRLKDKIDNLSIKIPDGLLIVVSKEGIPTGRVRRYALFSTPRLIGRTKFDTTYKIKSTGKYVATYIFDKKNDLTLQIWQKGYDYLQIFIPPARESIAIEPMTCAPDAFNNKQGLRYLDPGETFSGEYEVRLK